MMEEKIPRSVQRDLKFENGTALGMSQRWEKGQAEFDLAVAIAKGTPSKPLVEPEDLFEAKIVNATPKAKSYGIEIGMFGKEAVELMLKAGDE
jgi:hypothetical protein